MGFEARRLGALAASAFGAGFGGSVYAARSKWSAWGMGSGGGAAEKKLTLPVFK